MREIKFRAWDIEGKKMVEWGEFFATLGEHKYGYLVDQNNFITMQYTGLKDKNGKEIYEGDIVQSKNGRYKVIWQDRDAGFAARISGGVMPLSNACFYYAHDEVIGNIYENPDLTPLEK